MNSIERAILAGAAAHFHQDFDLDDWSTRDLFIAVARGLPDAHRTALLAGLEAMLQAHLTESDYRSSWWALGADMAPERSEVEDFVVWARSPAGQLEIESDGPIATSVFVHADLDRSPD